MPAAPRQALPASAVHASRTAERNGCGIEGAGEGATRFEVWPHRALDASQSRLVVMLVAAVMLPIAALPAVFGLWPVSVIVIGSFLAFTAFFLHNGKPQALAEMVEISADRVVVTHCAAGGASETFDPYWARVDLRSDHYVENRLTLRQSGKAVEIGRCLAPEERATLADALTTALAVHRSGAAVVGGACRFGEASAGTRAVSGSSVGVNR